LRPGATRRLREARLGERRGEVDEDLGELDGRPVVHGVDRAELERVLAFLVELDRFAITLEVTAVEAVLDAVEG
jgi:hypothetical protein